MNTVKSEITFKDAVKAVHWMHEEMTVVLNGTPSDWHIYPNSTANWCTLNEDNTVTVEYTERKGKRFYTYMFKILRQGETLLVANRSVEL